MAVGRAYQAGLTVAADIGDPSGRVYQAALATTEPAAALTARVYQAALTTAAGGTGTGRVYQAGLTTSLPLEFTPSGVLTRRGAGMVPLAIRAFRAGEL
jgi:hypothetical protein